MTRFSRGGILRLMNWWRRLKSCLGFGCWKDCTFRRVFFMNGVGIQGFVLKGSGGGRFAVFSSCDGWKLFAVFCCSWGT